MAKSRSCFPFRVRPHPAHGAIRGSGCGCRTGCHRCRRQLAQEGGGWETWLAPMPSSFGSPTYMGSVSWQFKKFADASSKPWYTQSWKDKIFGGFTASSNVNGDKHSTLHYFMTLAMQHGGIWVGTGQNYNNTKASKRDDINYLASSAGPMAQTPGDASGDEMNAGDLETARRFGQRVAAIADRFKA